MGQSEPDVSGGDPADLLAQINRAQPGGAQSSGGSAGEAGREEEGARREEGGDASAE